MKYLASASDCYLIYFCISNYFHLPDFLMNIEEIIKCKNHMRNHKHNLHL